MTTPTRSPMPPVLPMSQHQRSKAGMIRKRARGLQAASKVLDIEHAGPSPAPYPQGLLRPNSPILGEPVMSKDGVPPVHSVSYGMTRRSRRVELTWTVNTAFAKLSATGVTICLLPATSLGPRGCSKYHPDFRPARRTSRCGRHGLPRKARSARTTWPDGVRLIHFTRLKWQDCTSRSTSGGQGSLPKFPHVYRVVARLS